MQLWIPEAHIIRYTWKYNSNIHFIQYFEINQINRFFSIFTPYGLGCATPQTFSNGCCCRNQSVSFSTLHFTFTSLRCSQYSNNSPSSTSPATTLNGLCHLSIEENRNLYVQPERADTIEEQMRQTKRQHSFLTPVKSTELFGHLVCVWCFLFTSNSTLSLCCSVLLQTTNDIMHFIWALSPDWIASVFRLFKRQETRLNGQIPESKSSSWWSGRRKRGWEKPQWESLSNENRMNHCQLIIYKRLRAVYWMWKPQKIAYIQIVTTFYPLFLN